MAGVFGNAVAKPEGAPVEGWGECEPQGVETTYVERRVPLHLEDDVHDLIDNFLQSKGYEPEDL